VIEAALTEKLERLEARRFALTAAPRKAPGSSPTVPATHIPADVRRAVYARDGSRCSYRDARGRRCSERNRLQFHHRHPFALGGDHSPANVALLCGAHNTLMAETDYGAVALSHGRGS
jgi:5-methylcytosine-specific restriction endonuclease McrA